MIPWRWYIFKPVWCVINAVRRKKLLDAWREAVAIEPENWIIRKQIWAIEHPERFYAGEVDFDWQAAQIAEGR